AGRPGRPRGSWRRASKRRSAAALRPPAPASSARAGSRLPLLEEHEDAQLLVADEAVLGSGGHEDGMSLAELNLLPLDLERAPALGADVALAVVGGGRAAGPRRAEQIAADREPGRGVAALVTADAGSQPPLDPLDVERLGRLQAHPGSFS